MDETATGAPRRSGLRTRAPFLRWSFVRMVLSMRTLLRDWQVGDGREEALARYVLAHARAGDLDDVIRTIDRFGYEESFLINVGDEKGAILDGAVRRARPALALELGTYCGYSALRIVRAMPEDGHVVSLEFNPANADIARRIWAHAGVADRVTCVVGTLGDGGGTIERLEAEHGVGPDAVGLVFLDHDKDEYVPDLQRIVGRGWLRVGGIAVADNVRFPGAPAYRKLMDEAEGRTWRTTEHAAHAEYQTLIKDVVLESAYLGASD